MKTIAKHHSRLDPCSLVTASHNLRGVYANIAIFQILAHEVTPQGTEVRLVSFQLPSQATTVVGFLFLG